jgi:hypothetical protein
MLLTLCLELARHTECSQIQCVCPSCPLSDCPQAGADAVSCGPIRQNLRVVYDKNGKKMVSTESGSNVEDPASFFANVFGGERFMDYVRPCLWPIF